MLHTFLCKYLVAMFVSEIRETRCLCLRFLAMVVVVVVDDDTYYWVYLSFDHIFQVYYIARQVLLQSATACSVTKCDGLLLQSATAFSVQNAISVITKWNSYNKV